jgi:fumarate reductase subunit D
MSQHRRDAAYRRDGLWLAAFVHRLSGVLLAAFLPLHFLVLGLAIEGEARLDGFLRWTDQPLVKLAEVALLFLLALHLAGGVRVLVIENLSWRADQRRMAGAALAIAVAVAGAFFLRLV